MPHAALKPTVSVTAVQDEAVLLDLSSGQYFGLNETGKVIIDGLQNGDSTEHIAQTLCERFDVAADDANRDVEALLEDLARADLLSPVD